MEPLFYLTGRQKKDRHNDKRESGITVIIKVTAPDLLQECLLGGATPSAIMGSLHSWTPTACFTSWKVPQLTKQGSNKPLLCACVCVSHCRVQLCYPWTVSHQAPLSTGFPRQEYRNGWPFPSPGDLPSPGIEPRSLHCRRILHHWATWEAQTLPDYFKSMISFFITHAWWLYYFGPNLFYYFPQKNAKPSSN